MLIRLLASKYKSARGINVGILLSYVKQPEQSFCVYAERFGTPRS